MGGRAGPRLSFAASIITRRAFSAAAAVLGGLLVLPRVPLAWPLQWPDFTTEAFEAAERTGRPVVIAVHADWCGICRAQEPGLLEITADPRFGDYHLLNVDYDTQKAVMAMLGAPFRSTIVLRRRGAELGRVINDNRVETFRSLFELGLA